MAPRLALDLLFILLIRMITLFLVIMVFQRDPNDDNYIYQVLSNNVLSHNEPYPLLSGVHFAAMKAAFSPLVGWVSEIAWIRAAFISCDMAIYAIFYAYFGGSPKFGNFRLLYIIGAFTTPITAIWAQDEIVASLPILAYYLSSANFGFGAAIGIGGILFFKIFYIFLLAAVAYCAPTLANKVLVMAAGTALVLVDQGTGFVPHNKFSSSIWALVDLDYKLQKFISEALVLAGMGLVILLSRWMLAPMDEKLLFLLFFSIFQTVFYHVNPEYFMFIMLPAFVLWFQDRIRARTIAAVVFWYWLSLLACACFALSRQFGLTWIAPVNATLLVFAFGLGWLTIYMLFNDAVKAPDSRS